MSYDLRYLITGCPKSGTHYMRELFTSAGIPCTHEGRYSTFTYKDDMPKNSGAVAEASWEASCYIENEILKIDRLVHVVRNPLQVIEALYNLGLFSNKAIDQKKVAAKFIYAKFPTYCNMSELDRCIQFWLDINLLIEAWNYHDKYIRVRVENITKHPREFFICIEHDTLGRSLFQGKGLGHVKRTRNLEVKEFKRSCLFEPLEERAEKYGYDIQYGIR